MYKRNKLFKSALSMLLAFSMLLTPCSSAFATEMTTAAVETKVLDYVVLGDSMTNGYGMSGYYPNGDHTDKGNVRGYQVDDIEEIYPYLFAQYLGNLPENSGKTVKMHQLAISGMRPEELRFLLDEEYKGDAYTWDRFDSDNVENGERWFAKVFRDKNENIPEDAGNARLRSEYQEAIKNAEVISINLGSNNFSTFLTDELKSGVLYDTGYRNYDTEKFEGLRQKLIDILAQEGYSIPNNEKVNGFVDLLLYTYAGFAESMLESVTLIRQMNPTAEIILMSLLNNMDGMKITIDEESEPLPMDKLYGALIESANVYLAGMDVLVQNQLGNQANVNTKPAIFVKLEDIHLMVDGMGEMDPDAAFDPINNILERRSIGTLTGNLGYLVSEELTTRKAVTITWDDLKESFDEEQFLNLETSEEKNAYVKELVDGAVNLKLGEALQYAVISDLTEEELVKSFVKEYFKPAAPEAAVMPKGIDVAYDLSAVLEDSEIEDAETKELLALVCGEETGVAKELEKTLVTEIYLGMRKAILKAAKNPGLNVTDFDVVVGDGLKETFENCIALVKEPVAEAVKQYLAGEQNIKISSDIAESLLSVEIIRSALHIYAHFMVADGFGEHPDAKGHYQIFEAMVKAYEEGVTTSSVTYGNLQKALDAIPTLLTEYGIYDKLGVAPGTDVDRAYNRAYNGAIFGEYVPKEDSYYVSIGDSVVTGVGLAGHSGNGYQTKVEDSFAYQFAKEMGLDYTQLGQSGLRTEDIRYILDETYEPDEYALENTFAGINVEEGGMDSYRETFKEEIEKADFITVGMGSNNFATFVTAQINQMLAGEKAYEMDWSRYVKDEGSIYVEQAFDEIRAYLAEAGLDVEVDFGSEMLQMAMNIVGIKVGGKLNLADLLTTILECYAYSYAGFATNYSKVLDEIHEINPKAQVAVLGIYNPFTGMEINFEDFGVEESVFKIGDYLDEFTKMIGMHYLAYAMVTPNTTYVSLPEVETIYKAKEEAGEATSLIKVALDLLKQFGTEISFSDTTMSFIVYLFELCTKNGETLHPSKNGHLTIKERICESFVFQETINGFWLEDTNWKFTGEEIKPVVYNRYKYVEGVDYELTYVDNIDPGKDTAKAVITGLFVDVEDTDLPYTITVVDVEDEILNGIDLTDVEIKAMSGNINNFDQTYTGSALKPALKAYYGTDRLVAGKDYTVSYKNNKNVFVYDENMTEEELLKIPTITVKGKGNYTGSQTIHFNIYPQDITKTEEGMKYSYKNVLVYNKGKVLSPSLSLKRGSKTLKANTDYTMTYVAEDGVESTTVSQPGNYTLVVNGIANYMGTLELPLTVTETSKDISKLKFSVKKIPYGDVIEDYITVKSGKTTLVHGVDYLVEYDSEVVENAGSYTVEVKGIGNYVGSKSVKITIAGVSIKNAKVAGLTAATYNGKKIRPNDKTIDVTLKVKEGKKNVVKTLVENVDYKIIYSENVTDAGTVKMTFQGIGNYTGFITKSFKINPYKLTDAIAAGEVEIITAENASYSKDGAKAAVKVLFRGKELTEGKDYTLSYANTKKVFDYEDTLSVSKLKKAPKVTVKGKGNYAGSISSYYDVVEMDLADLTVVVPNVVFSTKAGNYKTTVSVMEDSGKQLSSGKDFKVSYLDANGQPLDAKAILKAGTAVNVVVSAVSGKGYKGECTETIQILRVGMDQAFVNNLSFWYTGEEVYLTNKDGSLATDDSVIADMFGSIANGQQLKVYVLDRYGIPNFLKLGVDYEIVKPTYKNNIKKGTATVVLQGLGNFAGTYTLKYKIVARPTWLDIFDKVLRDK